MFLRYGSEQIRNVASIGGNLASASPIGDSSPVLIALEAKIIIDGKNKREILLKDFFKSYRKTVLKNNEIIKEIIIPIKKKTFLKCYKISKRIEDDISSIFMAISGSLKNNLFDQIKIVCGGMAATPSIAHKTQSFFLIKNLLKKILMKQKKLSFQTFNLYQI